MKEEIKYPDHTIAHDLECGRCWFTGKPNRTDLITELLPHQQEYCSHQYTTRYHCPKCGRKLHEINTWVTPEQIKALGAAGIIEADEKMLERLKSELEAQNTAQERIKQRSQQSFEKWSKDTIEKSARAQGWLISIRKSKLKGLWEWLFK